MTLSRRLFLLSRANKNRITNASVLSAHAYPLKNTAKRIDMDGMKRTHVFSLEKKNRYSVFADPKQRGMVRLGSSLALTNKDFEAIFRKAGQRQRDRRRGTGYSSANYGKVQARIFNSSMLRPSSQQLRLVMLSSAIPFVGFGFVDNIIMLAAGDMIEDYFHGAYHISILCAAALGNTVSDVVGLSLGGIIEQFARRLGIPDPALSKEQANMAITHWCSFIAQAGGITLGCLLGMFPLLFMDHEGKTELKKVARAEAVCLAT